MLLRKPPQKGFEKEKSMRSWKRNFVVSLLVGFALGLFVWVAAINNGPTRGGLDFILLTFLTTIYFAPSLITLSILRYLRKIWAFEHKWLVVAAAIIAGVITNQLVWSGTWTSYDPYSGVPPGTPVPLEYFEPFYWAGLPFHVAFSAGTGSIIAMFTGYALNAIFYVLLVSLVINLIKRYLFKTQSVPSQTGGPG